MEIREFQNWLHGWDGERGWNEVDPVHTLAHVVEEMGEVSRCVLTLEGYKPTPKSREEVVSELSEEIGDLMTMIFKLAYQYGVDVESALERNIVKVNGRFPLEKARQELEHYEKVQEEKKRRKEQEERRTPPHPEATATTGHT